MSIRNRSVAQKRDCFGLSRAAPLIDVNGTFKPFTIEHKMAAARYHKHTGKFLDLGMDSNASPCRGISAKQSLIDDYPAVLSARRFAIGTRG